MTVPFPAWWALTGRYPSNDDNQPLPGKVGMPVDQEPVVEAVVAASLQGDAVLGRGDAHRNWIVLQHHRGGVSYDVIDDDLSVIGSGPFYPDPTSYEQCREILERANIWGALAASVRSVITKGEKEEIPETPKFQKEGITHYLLGTNRVALEQARKSAEEHGLKTHILTSSLAGEAKEVAKVLVALARNIKIYHEPFQPPVCLLFGGETTVTVNGKGKGGRNQELALAALAEIGNNANILLLSGGTDGIDGNSTAAGAFADSGLFMESSRQGLSIEQYLDDNNSNAFFRAIKGLLEIGSTGTNVMDITLLIIDKEDL